MSDQKVEIAILIIVAIQLAICLVQMWNSSRSSAVPARPSAKVAKPMEPYAVADWPDWMRPPSHRIE